MTTSVEDYVKAEIMKTLGSRTSLETTASVVEEAMKEEFVPKKLVLTGNQVSASKLLKIKKKGFIDFPVDIFKPEDFDEKVRFMIPEVDEGYELPKEEAADILSAWHINDKVLVHGPTGSGKSSLIKQLCAITGRPFIRINATGDMDSSMVFGQLTAKDGSTVWEDGTVTEAVKYGAVLAWDEWEVTPPEIMMGMQWLLEDDSKLFLKEMPGTAADKFIVPSNNFRIVCLGNTQGQGDETGHHAGVNVQNTATVDRFGTTVKLDYLSEAHEVAILTGKTSITKEMATTIVKVAQLVRNAYKSGQLSLTMSPRTLIGVAKKMELGVSFNRALSLQYLNKLTDTNQRVAKELVFKVTGTKF